MVHFYLFIFSCCHNVWQHVVVLVKGISASEADMFAFCQQATLGVRSLLLILGPMPPRKKLCC